MDNYGIAKLEALLCAERLLVGHSLAVNCPICEGYNKFSVSRVQGGVLWNCFKASCDTKGSTITSGALVMPDKRPPPLKPYRMPMKPLLQMDRLYFRERFGLVNEDIEGVMVSGDDRYIFPINGIDGWSRGYIVREPLWGGEPTCPRRGTETGLGKAITYMHASGPTQSWYPYGNTNTLVIVEDMLSAMCVRQMGVSAVALLGTHLNNDKVREIAVFRPKEVIIALDEDATDQAFKLAKKWGLAFRKTRVAVLEQDLKDEDNENILEVLGL